MFELTRIISELRYEDIYPESFVEFRKKYLKLMKVRKITDLYVQFHNHYSDTMTRTPYDGNEVYHKDPIGMYAYPMEYVLKNPADVWYGANAKYLRVLQDTSKNKLIIDSIDSRDAAESLLFDMGFNHKQILDFYNKIRKSKQFRITGANKESKRFLAIVQYDLEGELDDRGEYPVRTGKQQSQLFMKAGYDAIEDQSRHHNRAVINDREPQQIIFLNRAAFKVAEVVDLRGGIPQKRLGVDTVNEPSPHVKRKFAAAIARIIEDKLKEGPVTYSLNGWAYYWTHNGRRIEVNITQDYTNLDNTKRHRQHKLHNEYYVHVKVQTELGTIEVVSKENETFNKILDNVRRQYISLKKAGVQSDWKPQTAKDFENYRIEQRRQRARQNRRFQF